MTSEWMTPPGVAGFIIMALDSVIVLHSGGQARRPTRRKNRRNERIMRDVAVIV